AERGNTATTAHFVAVHDHVLNGAIRSGDRVMFAINGSGLTVGNALYTFDDLPDRIRGGGQTLAAPPRSSPHPRARTASPGAPRARIESVGVLNACFLATQLMQGRKIHTAMVLAAEVENASLFRGARRGVTETASAMILDRSPGGTGFGSFLFRSFTDYVDLLACSVSSQ